MNSALGWGRKIAKLNSVLGWGRKITGSTKISYNVIIGIDPSICHVFGPDPDYRQLN